MIDRRHPSVLGSHSLKQRGVWVRDLRTGHRGYISYVEKPRPDQCKKVGLDHRAKLWIIFPARPVNRDLKIHAAGSAYVEEVRVLRKKRRERFAHPFPIL